MTNHSRSFSRYAIAAVVLVLISFSFFMEAYAGDQVYGKGTRRDRNGWIFIHIEGSPSQRGEQYGYLVAREIAEFIEMLKVYQPYHSGRNWYDFQNAARTVILPKVEREYLEEIQGIVRGMKKNGVTAYDRIDLIAMNAFIELGDYYFSSTATEGKTKVIDEDRPPLRCSAFIATGSQTKDGKIVLAHNTWADYILGQRGNIILDLKPTTGNRILMQCSAAGFIHSGTDFAITSAGLIIGETTIALATAFDVNGIPEFVRIRKACQYATSIDEFATIMRTGNNGGYANTWLIGDTKTNEIAKLELGYKNTALYRSMDGYYDGMNFVDDSKMIREECSASLWDTNGNWPFDLLGGNSVSARRQRWIQLLNAKKGAVDINEAKAFMGDQIDPYTGVENPGGYVLMRRREINTATGSSVKPSGACDGKVVTAELAKTMSFSARMDHPDGSEFSWTQFFIDHPEFEWQKPFLRDLKNHPWTLFQSIDRR